MLLAAACCIPAILSVIFTSLAIFQMNRRPEPHDSIEGANGATEAEMQSVDRVTRMFLAVIQFPLFIAILLAILIAGEVNFFSPQVTYQTEPFGNVGEWGGPAQNRNTCFDCADKYRSMGPSCWNLSWPSGSVLPRAR